MNEETRLKLVALEHALYNARKGEDTPQGKALMHSSMIAIHNLTSAVISRDEEIAKLKMENFCNKMMK